MKKIYQRTMTICVASLFEEILVMVIVFSFSETNFQRTMDHMCQTAFSRESWSWSSSFSFPLHSMHRANLDGGRFLDFLT